MSNSVDVDSSRKVTSQKPSKPFPQTLYIHVCLLHTFVCLFVYYALTPPACGLSLFLIKLCSVLKLTLVPVT